MKQHCFFPKIIRQTVFCAGFAVLVASMVTPGFGQDQHLPAFTVSKVFTSHGGVHSTTRGNIRLVFTHRDRWLVFHGEPNMYHFSADGLHWTGAEIKEFGSRSHLLEGDTIFSYVDTQTDPNPATRRTRSAMVQGTIQGDRITWGSPQVNDLTVGYYADLQRDSTGRFTVSGRVVRYDDAGMPTGITVDWGRSVSPGDAAHWSPQLQAVQQVSDRKTSEIHENVPVEDGRTYVIGMVGVEGTGRLYGNLFDGTSFSPTDTLLAENMSNVRGTDKRMSAVWEPRSRIIHLSYVDHDSRLFYRTCKSPYRDQDWSPAVQLKPFNVFTNVMSLDTTKTPAEVWLLYGKTKFEHPDPRWQSGELYVEKFDGQTWSQPVLVSEPGTTNNWYPNINEDAGPGIGVLYLKGLPPNQAAIKDMDFDIMFSSTGAPRKVVRPDNAQPSATVPPAANALPGVTDVLVDSEDCRGAHVTTRPHNRKVVYHQPSRTWFLFHGTGHWIDKLGDAGLELESIAWRSSADGVTFSPLVPAVVGNGHSSSVDVLLADDRIWLTEARFGYWRDRAGIPALVDGKPVWHKDRLDPRKPNYYAPYEIFPFDIRDARLVAGNPAEALPGDRHIGHAGPHYGSLTRDSTGHLWVAARALVQAEGRLAVWTSRSVLPDDASQWERHTLLFESQGPGSLAPQILALDDGRVACVLFAKHEKMTCAFVYDPHAHRWGELQVIGSGYESKRASAVFDAAGRRLHVVYTDEAGDARHRFLSAPYSSDNWTPKLNSAGMLVARQVAVNKGDDDLSLSVNSAVTPATLALICRGPDQRLHLRHFDGQQWSSKDVMIGLQDPAMTCDEVSTVMDYSNGLAFAYWCQWTDPRSREEHNDIGHLRFGLIRDVASLFAE